MTFLRRSLNAPLINPDPSTHKQMREKTFKEITFDPSYSQLV